MGDNVNKNLTQFANKKKADTKYPIEIDIFAYYAVCKTDVAHIRTALQHTVTVISPDERSYYGQFSIKQTSEVLNLSVNIRINIHLKSGIFNI